MKIKNKSGFTLIELLIVVAIIAILAAIAIPNFLLAQVRAKASASKSNLRSMATAMESYRVDQGDYPEDFPVGLGNFYGGVITLYKLSTPVAYITSIPKDPFNYNIQSLVQQRLYIDLYHDYMYLGPYTINWWVENAPGNVELYNQFGAGVGKGGWILNGNGPLGYNYDLQEPYDPTNGTVSWGTIYRVGP